MGQLEPLGIIRSIPIFNDLADADLERIVHAPENDVVEFAPNKAIIEENEIGDCMYVILAGTVDVRISAIDGRQITIATLHAGDFFGEQALLPGFSGKRNASVSSLQSTRLFRIAKRDFAATNQDEPFVSSDGPERAPEQQLQHVLRNQRLFRSLSDEELATILDWTEVVTYDAGELILRESEPGEEMFVITQGSVEVFVTEHDEEISVAYLDQGQYFGEQALLPESSGRRNASVRARRPVSLVRLAKEYFRLVLNRDQNLTLALDRAGTVQRRQIDTAKNSH